MPGSTATGSGLPVAAHVNPLKVPIEKVAFQIAAGAIRGAIQKSAKSGAGSETSVAA